MLTMVPVNAFAATKYKVTCYMAYGYHESNAMPIKTSSIEDNLAYVKEIYYYDNENEFILPEPTVSLENYEFMGWSTDGSLKYNKNITIPKGSKGNKIYIARWLGKEINVNFDSQGGNTVYSKVARYNDKIGTLPLPTRDGYEFDGWYTEPEKGKCITSKTIVPVQDVTYYAHWSPKEYSIALIDCFGDGSNKYINYTIETDDLVIGNPLGDYDINDPHPYIFEGWRNNKNGKIQSEIFIPKGSFGNKHFTAVWKDNPCYSNHIYKNVTVPATTNSEGAELIVCKNCGISETIECIPKIDKIALNSVSYSYDGYEKKPKVNILDENENKIKNGIDYTIVYRNNKNIGIATAIITFKGKYFGTVNKQYKINPKGTKIKSIHPESKKLNIKWNKQSSQISGYQIEYTYKGKNVTSKIVTIKGASITSKNITNIINNIDYYVRIRTYKDVADTRFYSSWSKQSKVHVDKIQLSSKNATLYRGLTKKLTLKYIPYGAKVTWKSSNKKIVTVSKTGKIKAIKLGKATIYAKYKGITYKAKISVTYMKPNMAALIYDYDTRDNSFILKIQNNSSKPITILKGTTKVLDCDYTSYDRRVKLSKVYIINPGKIKTIRFKVIGSRTWPDHNDFRLYYYFKLDGKKYYAKADSFVVTKYRKGSKWINTYRDKEWFEDWRCNVIP